MFDKELTDEEYEKLSDSYVVDPPKLSGKPGHITVMRERALIDKLLSAKYARIIKVQAEQKCVSPSVIIETAIQNLLNNSAWYSNKYNLIWIVE